MFSLFSHPSAEIRFLVPALMIVVLFPLGRLYELHNNVHGKSRIY